jgi:hypothetical protein
MSPRRLVAMLWVLMLSLLIVAPMSALAADDPLVVTDCNYGDVYQFAPASCTASLENKGTTPLTLSIVSVQPGNTVEPAKLTLAPRARADLMLRIPIENVAGSLTWTYRIDDARNGKEPHFVRASGFITSVLDVAHPLMNFGLINPSTPSPVTQTIALTSSLDSKLRATRIVSSPSVVHARIGADAKSLTVDIAPDAPWGPFDDVVKLAIESSQQKQVWVQVTGSVAGDVGPEKNPHWLGEILWQPERTLVVPLIDNEGRDFTIGEVISKDFAATYDSAPCEPARKGCRNLVIHVSDAQPAGLVKSNLDVTLTDRKKHLTVAIWGVFGERPKPGETAVPPAITKVPLPSQGDDAVSVTPPLKVQPDPPGTGPLLKWTIGQQKVVHGYQVFRGDSANGPFTLMQPQVIPKLDNGKGPVAYRWRDTTAVKGQTYWYYVAVLYSSGDRRPMSGPLKTLAK